MAKVEKEILRQSATKPIFWKRFIFLVKANSFHPTIKFMAEISETAFKDSRFDVTYNGVLILCFYFDVTKKVKKET